MWEIQNCLQPEISLLGCKLTLLHKYWSPDLFWNRQRTLELRRDRSVHSQRCRTRLALNHTVQISVAGGHWASGGQGTFRPLPEDPGSPQSQGIVTRDRAPGSRDVQAGSGGSGAPSPSPSGPPRGPAEPLAPEPRPSRGAQDAGPRRAGAGSPAPASSAAGPAPAALAAPRPRREFAPRPPTCACGASPAPRCGRAGHGRAGGVGPRLGVAATRRLRPRRSPGKSPRPAPLLPGASGRAGIRGAGEERRARGPHATPPRWPPHWHPH